MSNLLSTMMNMPQQISNDEISRLSKARQIFSDCYLVASINSLTRTEKGRELLKSHIRRVNTNSSDPTKSGYLIHYSNVNNKQKDVFVSQAEIDSLNIKRARRVRHSDAEENTTLKALEISMSKLLKEKPSLKYIISRFHPSIEKFEYDLPSNFLKMFVNKDSMTINEKTVKLSLKSDKDKAKNLLKQIENSDGNHHFFAGTSYPFCDYFMKWHCFVIKNVNSNNNSVTVYDPRSGKDLCVDIDFFMKKFKFISGYFEK